MCVDDRRAISTTTIAARERGSAFDQTAYLLTRRSDSLQGFREGQPATYDHHIFKSAAGFRGDVLSVLGVLTGMALGALFFGDWDAFPWVLLTAAALLIVLWIYRSTTRRRGAAPPT